MRILMIVLGACLFLAAGCGNEQVSVDYSDPVSVVETVFVAAKKEIPFLLSILCHPPEEKCGDSCDICEVATTRKWLEFQENFANGKVTGAPRISGDKAEVDYTFGPGRKKTGTMTLVKHDGRWILTSL